MKNKDKQHWFDKLPGWVRIILFCTLPAALMAVYGITRLGYHLIAGPVELIPPKATDTVVQRTKVTDTIRSTDTLYIEVPEKINAKKLSPQDLNKFVPFVKQLLKDSALNKTVFFEILGNSNGHYIANQLIQALRRNNIETGFGQFSLGPDITSKGLKFKIDNKYLVIYVGLFE